MIGTQTVCDIKKIIHCDMFHNKWLDFFIGNNYRYHSSM